MMNKKFCVVIIALIMLCFATGAVFARLEPTTCPRHRTNWHDGCRDCTIAKNNNRLNREAREAAQKELNAQKKLLAQKQKDKDNAKSVEEANKIEQQISVISITIVQLQYDLNDLK